MPGLQNVRVGRGASYAEGTGESDGRNGVQRRSDQRDHVQRAQHAKRTAILDDTIVEIVNHLNVARTVIERASRPGGIDRGTSGAADNLPSQPR